MQIKAGFIKEWQLFTRTGKLIGIILAICAFAIFDPLMMKATEALAGAMKEMTTAASTSDNGGAQPLITADIITVSEGGAVISAEDIAPVMSISDDAQPSSANDSTMELMDTMTNMLTKEYIFASTMADIFSTSLLIIMLVMMNAAGGEMKKRSTIIPDCSGLESFNYILPKFVLYPITIFVTTMAATVINFSITNALFEKGTIDLMNCLGSGALAGAYLVFMLFVMMTIGICTSRPGIATIFVFIGSTFVPIILSSLEIDSFNPFALRIISANMVYGDAGDNAALNIAVSLLITAAVCVTLYFITGFVLKARKINNLGEAKPHF